MWYHDISDVFLELAKSSKYAGKWIVWNLVLSEKPYFSISYNTSIYIYKISLLILFFPGDKIL